MSKTDRPIPSEGQWFRRNNHYGSMRDRALYKENPADTVRVEKVEPGKERFYTALFKGFDAAGEPLLGRHRWISFETWRSNASRYKECDPPRPPAPRHTESGAPRPAEQDIEARLRAIEAKQDDILTMLRGITVGPLFRGAR